MRNRGKEHTTIIKRSSRKNHHAFHGGAWKVAFADFTLAMMALFMVLWIMGSVSEKERQEVVAMLNGQSIFEGNSLTPITQKDGVNGIRLVINNHHPLPQSLPQPSFDGAKLVAHQVSPSSAGPVTGKSSLEDLNTHSANEIEDLARIIMKITSTYDVQANLKMEIVPQGLRILVSDDQKREMFHRSSAILTPFFKRLLTAFAPELNKIDNKIIITGHTDGTHFRDQVLYNNWNLSGERALQARTVLTQGGLDPQKILQVSGMADQVLLDPKHPLSSVNRRIEIMVLTHSASDGLYKFFGQHGEKIIKSLDAKLAKTS